MPHCPSCRQSRWMYHWDVPLMGWFTSLSGRLPYECLSCGWRGWWSPGEHGGTSRKAAFQRAWGSARSAAQTIVRRIAPVASRVSAVSGAYRATLQQRLAQLQLPRPARPRVFGGAALLGVIVGIIAALVALSTRAADLPDTVGEVSAPTPAVAPPIAAAAPVQPTPAVDPQPRPEALPVALTIRATATPVRASAPATAPTTGRVTNAVERTAARPQAPAAKIAGYRGGLNIESAPDGARVFVDGSPVGFTPIQLQDLPVGSRVVRVEAEGYETWTTAARVVANQRARVTAVLQRSSQR